MKVTRTSIASGITRELDLPITQEQSEAHSSGVLIQYAFPNLSADQREFLMTGISAEEWERLTSQSEQE